MKITITKIKSPGDRFRQLLIEAGFTQKDFEE